MAKRTTEVAPKPEQPAEYTVLARRYRPKQFDELIGQEPVAQALKNALTGGRVAHAYLFTGSRGVGKTSAARILAKALNCEKGPTPTPCDKCDICTSIATGDDVDVLEIDGASNRGIDNIRELRQNAQLHPARARYKIYIIDEVHALSKDAFNALLKTLEEPPGRVKFIFATTEAGKVPITILSRCQRFDFALIATPRIAEHLRLIVKQEKLEADDAALELVARRAAGSMRDAESLLDQLLAFGERLTPALVHRMLGTASAERISAIAEAAIGRDVKKSLELLAVAQTEGAQAGELLDQLVEFWRDLLLVASCGTTDLNVSASPSLLQTLTKKTSVEAILAGLDILTAAKSRMKLSSYGKVLVEMAVIRLARLDQMLSISDLWSAAQRGETAAVSNRIAPANDGAMAEKKKLMNRVQMVPSL
ncbi:MAG: DNA polymerase III subunit gamma/tau [Gemmataceae bacterium]